jgi:hypothetical protein
VGHERIETLIDYSDNKIILRGIKKYFSELIGIYGINETKFAIKSMISSPHYIHIKENISLRKSLQEFDYSKINNKTQITMLFVTNDEYFPMTKNAIEDIKKHDNITVKEVTGKNYNHDWPIICGKPCAYEIKKEL